MYDGNVRNEDNERPLASVRANLRTRWLFKHECVYLGCLHLRRFFVTKGKTRIEILQKLEYVHGEVVASKDKARK